MRAHFSPPHNESSDLSRSRQLRHALSLFPPDFLVYTASNPRSTHAALPQHSHSHVLLPSLSLPPQSNHRSAKIYGTSGGGLTGCLLFLDIDLDALAEYVYICVAKARSSWRGKFLLRDYCRGAIEQFCTRDAHKILQGRFELSITQVFPWYKNLRVNQFPSYEFLVQSLLCSACLVPLAGLPMWLPGYGLCFDGGVSDFQLIKGLARNGTFCKLHCRKTNPKNIVVVCPFYSSRADIRPSKFVPIWWAFFPPEPYKLKELFELGYKDAHAWADKQEETSPEGSPRGAENENENRNAFADEKENKNVEGEKRTFEKDSDDSDDDWEWRRREKAAAAAARDGAKAGAAAWRASGPESNSSWWTYGARQNLPTRRRRDDEKEGKASRASVTRDNVDADRRTGKGVASPASPTRQRRSFDGFWGSRRDKDVSEKDKNLHETTSGGFTEWAAECQEWASLSAEAAARRAITAARTAARNASDFARHASDPLGPNVHNKSGKFCEAQAAAEAMRRVAEKQTERRAREVVGAELAAETAREEAEKVSDDAVAALGTFRAHRLVVKWLACLVVYFELVCQAGLHSTGAFFATAIPGVNSRRLWKRSKEFCTPLPRVLLQPVPGVRVGAKINLETARLLGHICVTYRVLCYAVHVEIYA